ncbi:MAG TPA: QueT transporter family protein [bacterium]
MKEIFTVWKETKNVMLIAVSAAVYAASLIPFKPLVIIPGSTEIRPGAVFPVILGLLFGPAGAWGSAIGNTIADIFGMFGPGTIPGFIGNFFYAYVPFKLWNRLGIFAGSNSPDFKRKNDIAQFVFVAILGSLICALLIGWGMELMGLMPFAALGVIIMLNNTIVSLVLGPFLVSGLFARIRRWGLIYDDFAKRKALISLRIRIGVLLVLIGILGGMTAGLTISTGFYSLPLGLASVSESTGGLGVIAGVFPFIAIFLAGIALL